MEGKAKTIIERIIAQRSIGGLLEDDRIQLAMFVAIQMQGVPNSREHLLARGCGLRRALGERDFDPAFIENYPEMTPEDAKAISLIMQ